MMLEDKIISKIKLAQTQKQFYNVLLEYGVYFSKYAQVFYITATRLAVERLNPQLVYQLIKIMDKEDEEYGLIALKILRTISKQAYVHLQFEGLLTDNMKENDLVIPAMIASLDVNTINQFPLELSKDALQKFIWAVFNHCIPCDIAQDIVLIFMNHFNSKLRDFGISHLKTELSETYDYFEESYVDEFISICQNLFDKPISTYKLNFIKKMSQFDRTSSYIITRQEELFQNVQHRFQDNEKLATAMEDIRYALSWYWERYRTSMSPQAHESILKPTLDAIQRATNSLADIENTSGKGQSKRVLRDIYSDMKEMNSSNPYLDARIATIVESTSNYVSNYPNPFVREDEPKDDIIALEEYDRRSAKLQSAQAKIYHAYKNYKNNEQKVDDQITKMCGAVKRLAIGDVRTEIIEGKKVSAIGLLKKALGTAAVFSFGPIKGLILLVIRYALKKGVSNSERRKILLELQVELDIVKEKIEDARGDGNRQAKYALMRTKAELEAAIGKIRYNLDVDQRNLDGAKKAVSNPIGVRKGRL